MSNNRTQAMIEDATVLIENHISSTKSILCYDLPAYANNWQATFRFFCVSCKADLDLFIISSSQFNGQLWVDDKEYKIEKNSVVMSVALSKGEHVVKLVSNNISSLGGLLRIGAIGGKKLDK